MKQTIIKLIGISSAILLLSACSTIHDKLAAATMQHKQLADGSSVTLDINVRPNVSWSCHSVAEPQFYNWSNTKMQAQLHFATGESYLMDKAVAYANEHQLKTNYINIDIPNETTIGSGGTEIYLQPGAKASIQYYQCKQVNPDRRIGYQQKTAVGITAGG